jgi:hypothetical protein
MRDTVYFLTFEGFADWQAALALCEIRRPGDWRCRRWDSRWRRWCRWAASRCSPMSRWRRSTCSCGAADRAGRPSLAARRRCEAVAAFAACMPRAHRWPASTAACWRWPAPACSMIAVIPATGPGRSPARCPAYTGEGQYDAGAGGERRRHDHRQPPGQRGVRARGDPYAGSLQPQRSRTLVPPVQTRPAAAVVRRRSRGGMRLSDYQFGSNSMHHLFCRHCGVRSFGRGHLEVLGGDFFSVNLACLDGVEPQELIDAPLRFADGRHDNWGASPAETRHL